MEVTRALVGNEYHFFLPSVSAKNDGFLRGRAIEKTINNDIFSNGGISVDVGVDIAVGVSVDPETGVDVGVQVGADVSADINPSGLNRLIMGAGPKKKPSRSNFGKRDSRSSPRQKGIGRLTDVLDFFP